VYANAGLYLDSRATDRQAYARARARARMRAGAAFAQARARARVPTFPETRYTDPGDSYL
jgi:hypothetical protein